MNQTNCTTVASPSIPSTSRKADSIDNPDDATWILTSAFIIFTMQSGFGLLESGSVSRKNEANIFIKNAIDVIFGGLSYWIFGFAFTFALDHRGNGFCGLGYFLTDADENQMGNVYSRYFFQLSFATTATTIVSGAMAERTSLKAYTMYSFLSTLTYSFPAHWIWDHGGWLNRMGAVDIAGCGPVHLVGGVSGLVATLMLKPRIGRFDENAPPRQMASPTNVILGTFMLWWGWLGFNCGSTFGITGMKWKLASRFICCFKYFFSSAISVLLEIIHKQHTKTDHSKALINGHHTSALADHVTSTGHSLKWDPFEILANGRSDGALPVK